MKPKEIEKIYEMIKGYFEKYLQKEGVQLPKLYNKGKFSKEALVLVYLAQHYPNTKVVTKQELTEFIKKFLSQHNRCSTSPTSCSTKRMVYCVWNKRQWYFGIKSS
jgi:hypothetical protein